MGETLTFAWDEVKAASNLAKHKVAFETAALLFLDPDRVDFDASHPGDGERRRKAVGQVAGRVLTVVYTPRRGAIRIISARRANVMECKAYG